MSFKDKVKTLEGTSVSGFFGLIALTFIFSWIPIISWPFDWIQTFFHELSHGLAALMTGGRVLTIELNLNGSGLCTSSGGIRLFVAFAGYAGAILWGALIYMMADHPSEKTADRLAILMITLIGITLLFWARDFITILILCVMIIPFAFVLKIKDAWGERLLMQITGLYVLLDAIKSPSYLCILQRNDARTLGQITFSPAFVWILIWLGTGIATMFFLYKWHKRHHKD